MRVLSWSLTAAASTTIVQAHTMRLALNEVCTVEYAKPKLPSSDFIQGITFDPSTLTAVPVTNVSASSNFFSSATIEYCNVTFAYTHNGRDDPVLVVYWLPAPDKFENCYLSTGGDGYSIYSGPQSLPGGVIYGAVSGATDEGFGSIHKRRRCHAPRERNSQL
jgi:tannase